MNLGLGAWPCALDLSLGSRPCALNLDLGAWLCALDLSLGLQPCALGLSLGAWWPLLVLSWASYWLSALSLARLAWGWLATLRPWRLEPLLLISWLRLLEVQALRRECPGACLGWLRRLGRCLGLGRSLPLGLLGVLWGLKVGLGCCCCLALLLGLLCLLRSCLLRDWPYW